MRVIGTVGLAGSGKGEAAAVAEEQGVPVVTMGDVIREECRDRGLREENGPAAIAERSLPLVRDALDEHDTVLVDGIRSGVEVDAFEEAFGDAFYLVSIEAPFETRAERISERGRDTDAEDGGEALHERDERELGFGMDEAMERADLTIANTDSLETFRQQVERVIEGTHEHVQ